MPDPKKHIDDDYTYVRGYVRKKRSNEDGGDNGDRGDNGAGFFRGGILILVLISLVLIGLVAWQLRDTDEATQQAQDEATNVAVPDFTELTPVAQQTKTGTIHNNGNPMPKIPLEAGQWVEVRIWLTGINPNFGVRILDPSLALVKDLGTASTYSYSFQAQKTGEYTVSIGANPIYSIGYTVKYTIYS